VSLFRKKEPAFDFSAAVNGAIAQAMQGGMSRRVVIEKLEAIVAAQERTAATNYRSSYLPPVLFDPNTFEERT
jgi:hypothetical protein